MSRLKKFADVLPACATACALLVLGYFLLPHLVFFSFRPVLLLSTESAQDISASSGLARERANQRMILKNVQGVVFTEETLQDLQKSGRAFVASGEELLRMFKLQSVASYYVFEQVRDKNLKPDGSYIFFSESALFERVFEELKRRLPLGSVAVYERGIFRGDASFPDNFILECSVPAERLETLPLGWPVERIRETLEALKTREGDTLWPVLWSEGPASIRDPAAPDTAIPTAVRLTFPLLRFPYDSIRIIHDPAELIGVPRSSDLKSLLSYPELPPRAPLVLSVLLILAAGVRLTQWISWAIPITAALLVILFALLPAHQNWVLEGIAVLLPPSALLSWMAAADKFRASLNRAGRPFLQSFTLANFSGWIVPFLVVPGWLLSTLFWQFPSLPLHRCAVYGITAAPVMAALLFLAVWGIEVSNRPVYPRHIRTGLELALSAVLLIGCTSAWILAIASSAAWARWMALLEQTRGRSLEDAPGNYAAFFIASALGLKIFFDASPAAAAVLLMAAFAAGAIFAAAWISRAPSAKAA